MDGTNNKTGWRQQHTHGLMSWVLFVFLLFICPLSQASILLLLSGENSYYRETAESLQKTTSTLGISPDNFEIVTIGEAQQANTLNKPYELIVAIGSSAARESLLQNSNTPLLNIFTPKNAFDAIELSTVHETNRKISAIYLDQPLSRLITLSCLLKPEARNFGTIFGPVSQSSQSEIEALTNENGIQLNHAFLAEDNNPVAVLKPIVSKSDLFIAIPDHAILNRAIAKWILYMGFQQKVPVIGFSKAYTNAGALASVFSSPEGIGKHAGELIFDWLENSNQAIWNPQYPRYYTLSTNPAVARSLGISLPSERELYEKFQEQELKQKAHGNDQ